MKGLSLAHNIMYILINPGIIDIHEKLLINIKMMEILVGPILQQLVNYSKWLIYHT